MFLALKGTIISRINRIKLNTKDLDLKWGSEGGGVGAAFAPAGAAVAGAAADDAALLAEGAEGAGLVGFDLTDDLDGHLLEFGQELARLVLAALNHTQAFLPTAGELG